MTIPTPCWRESAPDLTTSPLALGGANFLRPINRIGNRLKPDQGRAVMEPLAADPVLGREATAILNGRGWNE